MERHEGPSAGAMHGARSAQVLGVALLWFALDEVASFEQAFTSLCGKKLRIMTHQAPPFINVDAAKCENQKCPPAAFGEDGGLTYKFVTNELKKQLELQCEEKGAEAYIEFDWYLPPSDRSSATGAVNLVCNGNFADNTHSNLNGTLCPSAIVGHPNFYAGPSPKGTCESLSDASCVSKGPDMVLGAVHVVVERVAVLQFSAPFLTVRQIVVKRDDPPPPILDLVLNPFKPFNDFLWLAIVVENIVMWAIFLLIERTVNEDIADGLDMFSDAFYWVASTFVGGADKAPCTMGGKIAFAAHALFSLVMISTYTGAVAAFLTLQATVPTVDGRSSLTGGAFSTVVRGPSWNSEAADPEYLGKFLPGGNGDNTTTPSLQFRYFQSLQESSSEISVKVMTAKRMESRDKDGNPLRFTSSIDPCQSKDQAGVELGAYDMVACATGYDDPRSLVFDAPSVYYELNRMHEARGGCVLKTAGSEFQPTGYGIGFPYKTAMDLPVSQAILTLQEKGVIDEYEDMYKIRSSDNLCQWNPPGVQMNITDMAGVFMLVGVLFFGGCVWAIIERRSFFHPPGEVTDEDKEEEFEKEVGEEKQLTAVKETIDFKDDEPIAAPGAKAEDDGPDPNGMTYQLDELQDQMDRIEALGKKLLDLRNQAQAPGSANAGPGPQDKQLHEHLMFWNQ